MRKEFNELVETMKGWGLFQKDDEVDVALTNLSNKIDEVEKRIECAVRSAREINQFVSKYTEDVDNHKPINMSVNDHDFILNRSDDVDIALDLGDNMCVSDNWYNLFSPKEEPKPIAVGNIEYDFPEDVYTIGNADNSEIIGDVYESVFNKFVELGIIVFEGDENFNFGKTNYTINDNGLIGMVVANQIDLSKVPIKREVFMTFESSWGEIDCDKEGNVMEIRGDEEINGERSYLYDIVKIDLVEYEKFLNSIDQELDHDSDDILAVGFWKKDNTYDEPDHDWRKNIFSTEDDEEDDEPPTMLCADSDKHKIVNNIISQLKAIDVDGETMEYILEQVGMDEQMFSQLFERQG